MTTKLQNYPQNSHHKALSLQAELAGQLALPQNELTLAAWAARYMDTEVRGIQSPNTFEAKKRDLTGFMHWYYDANDHLDIADWMPRDTQGFLSYLEGEGKAATTINRTLATLRKFARWVHEQANTPFVTGLPTKGVTELADETPRAKKLSKKEINQLFKAADRLALTSTRKNARPKRNRAILAVLYYTGLRVSELCALKRDQYTGTHLENIIRKGKTRTRQFYITTECRKYLDEYLDTERKLDVHDKTVQWLFLPFKWDKPLTRHAISKILTTLAQEAKKHSKDALHISPHRLRHTFGFEVWNKTRSDAKTAQLLGHGSTKHVGIYSQWTEEEEAQVLESISS